ncbi:uncharacterized protein UMAG_12333 [Mycosarcoma maydis]|uniref:Uncharacterized protein n=1 Tax=Mycosarcoma maydis TaxID=5270 RepID=A0A0D1E327_MYCMD|nr:uncharacterized protein UMAG_12333 [Ustilago maydis 521]KIS70221.1 hypothetical protein UMAG_12333 [Ustilago maydis 521]|eukprot:XP_011388415.1 hypothetical protein UMAG_12333 [Ustilago maydis 521]
MGDAVGLVDARRACAMWTPKITNHIITLEHADSHTTHYLTQLVQLSSPQVSLFVHCSPISSTTSAHLLSHTSASPQDASRAPTSALPIPQSTLLHSPALATDFALTISHPSSPHSPLSSSILASTTAASTSSLAASIAKRIATTLSIPHLLLSLDLPTQLVPSPGSIASPQDSIALLALEKAIRDACSLTLSQSANTL